MADIFISYSSKDKEQATVLTELLASAGLSVWIDQSGIEAATSWSEEIVDAIDSCSAFIVMLSRSSIESHNVVKEVSLASEKRKKILPLDVEPVELPKNMQYALAGIQRTSMTNIDSIIRAIGKLGLEATKAPEIKLVKEESGRKSLMILPFEDLSPTQDNQWFTDGMASELVSVLSNVKSLKLIDWNTSKMLRNKAVKTVELAREFSVRYFIEGQVRKFGDNIKISITLLDIETGDHLWQDSLKGTMDDVFDIQETVAEKVLKGLDIIVTKQEEATVTKKPTENAEAYELYLKGIQYSARHTKTGLEQALALYEEAVRLDPKFYSAFANMANTCSSIYRQYDRNPKWLDRVESAVNMVRELQGETALYAWGLSTLSLRRGDAESALRYAQRAVELDTNFAAGYEVRASALKALGRVQEAAEAWEQQARLEENKTNVHFSLLIALNELTVSYPGTTEYQVRLKAAAERAVPVYQRHLRLNPDDENARVAFANVLRYAGRKNEALVQAEKLSEVESLDANALYNLACLYLELNSPAQGMEALRRSVKKGYREVELFRYDSDLNPLRGTPEFEALMKELEEKVEEEKLKVKS
jgi:TolB-like protein/Flp pilus assembly protein TadD